MDNRLKNDETKLGVELEFSRLDDFEPHKVVSQVAPLKELLDIRTRLADLRNKVTSNDKLEELLDEVMRDTEKLKKIGSARMKKGG